MLGGPAEGAPSRNDLGAYTELSESPSGSLGPMIRTRAGKPACRVTCVGTNDVSSQMTYSSLGCCRGNQQGDARSPCSNKSVPCRCTHLRGASYGGIGTVWVLQYKVSLPLTVLKSWHEFVILIKAKIYWALTMCQVLFQAVHISLAM